MGSIVVIHVHPDSTVHNKKYTYSFGCDETCKNVGARNFSVGVMNPWKAGLRPPAFPVMIDGRELNPFETNFSIPIPDPCMGATIVINYDYVKPFYNISASASMQPYGLSATKFCPANGYADYEGDLRPKRATKYDDHGNPIEWEFYDCYGGRSKIVPIHGSSPQAGLAIDFGPPQGGPLNYPPRPSNMKDYFPLITYTQNTSSAFLIGRQTQQRGTITSSKQYIYDYERNEDGTLKKVLNEKGELVSVPIYQPYTFSGPSIGFSKVCSDINISLIAKQNGPYVRKKGTGVVSTSTGAGTVYGVEITNITTGREIGNSTLSFEDWYGSYQLNAYRDYGGLALLGSGTINIGSKTQWTDIQLEELFFSNTKVIPAFEVQFEDDNGNIIDPDSVMDPPPLEDNGDMGSGPEPVPDSYVGPVYAEANGFDYKAQAMTLEDGKKMILEIANNSVIMLHFMIGFSVDTALMLWGSPKIGSVGNLFRIVKHTEYVTRTVRKWGLIGKVFKFKLVTKEIPLVSYREVQLSPIYNQLARINAGLGGKPLTLEQFPKFLSNLANLNNASMSQCFYGELKARSTVKKQPDPLDMQDPLYVESSTHLESVFSEGSEDAVELATDFYNICVAVISFSEEQEKPKESEKDVPFKVPDSIDPLNPISPVNPTDSTDPTNPYTNPSPIVPETDCFHTITQDGLTIEDMPFPEEEEKDKPITEKKKYSYKVISQAEVVGDIEPLVMTLYNIGGSASGLEGDVVELSYFANSMEVDGIQYTAMKPLGVLALFPNGMASSGACIVDNDTIRVTMGGAPDGSTLVILGLTDHMDDYDGAVLKVRVTPSGCSPHIAVYQSSDIIEEADSEVLDVGLSPETYTVVVSALGYITATMDVTIDKGTKVLNIKLNKPQKRAIISITTSQPKSCIYINGIYRGKSPYTINEPYNGYKRYEVTAKKTVNGVPYSGFTVFAVDDNTVMPISRIITLKEWDIWRNVECN